MNPILGTKNAIKALEPQEPVSKGAADDAASGSDSAQFLGMLLGMGAMPAPVANQEALASGTPVSSTSESMGRSGENSAPRDLNGKIISGGLIKSFGKDQNPNPEADMNLLAGERREFALKTSGPDILSTAPPPLAAAQALLQNPELGGQRRPVGEEPQSSARNSEGAQKILDQKFLNQRTKGESEPNASLQSILSLLNALDQNSEDKTLVAKSDQKKSKATSESVNTLNIENLLDRQDGILPESNNGVSSKGEMGNLRNSKRDTSLLSHDFMAARAFAKNIASGDDANQKNFLDTSSGASLGNANQISGEIALNPTTLRPTDKASVLKTSTLANAASPKASLSLQSATGMMELQRSITEMAKAGKEEISIRLAPEHLGDLHIKLQMTDDKLKVKFDVESAEAKDLLAKGLSDLKLKLENGMPLSAKGEVRSVEIALQQQGTLHHEALRSQTHNLAQSPAMLNSEDFLAQNRGVSAGNQNNSTQNDSSSGEGMPRHHQGQARHQDQKERSPSKAFEQWEKYLGNGA